MPRMTSAIGLRSSPLERPIGALRVAEKPTDVVRPWLGLTVAVGRRDAYNAIQDAARYRASIRHIALPGRYVAWRPQGAHDNG